MAKSSPGGGPCTLYLVRHAIAEERGSAWPDDTLRPLTTRGTRRFVAGARGLSWLGVRLDQILTSPLVRTRQTADVLARVNEGHPLIEPVPALAPEHEADATLRALAAVARGAAVAVVGHEPGLGELAAHLIGARRPLEFRKGGICRIDVGDLSGRQAGRLVWALTPRVLRKLGT
ncbi:MAG: phosphohistidine phosphatase SixA [Acidobacteria bacterium]|nr:phosphohistidine phosphatase SixA [Acidobacteriota bacterium]